MNNVILLCVIAIAIRTYFNLKTITWTTLFLDMGVVVIGINTLLFGTFDWWPFG
jgi:hypothetical protein